MRLWFEETGDPPTSIDWCPSTGRASGSVGAQQTKWEREHPRWPGSTTVYRFYDSWAAAREAAGLAPGPRQPPGSLAGRVASARRMAAAGLAVGEIAERLGVSAFAAGRYLNAHGCERCGEPVVGDGRTCRRCATRSANPVRWTRGELIEAVREWAELEGRPPTQLDWSPPAEGESPNRWRREFPRWPPASAARIVFGSTNAMLEAAGFAPYNHRWTRGEIIAAIRAFHDSHGRPPRKVEWESASPSASIVLRTFGSFSAGIRAAGFRPHGDAHRWGTDRMLASMHAFRAEHGRFPRGADWPRSGPGHPAAATVYKRFGTWDAAIRAAEEADGRIRG